MRKLKLMREMMIRKVQSLEFNCLKDLKLRMLLLMNIGLLCWFRGIPDLIKILCNSNKDNKKDINRNS